MLARRIIAVTPDKAFGKQLTVALKAAGGAVDTYLTLEDLGHGEIHAALLVVHLDGQMMGAAQYLIPRLAGDTRMIAILPRSNLTAVVDIMQSSDRVAGLMVAEDFDMKLLSAMATRVLAGDIFGLEKHVPWGAQIHSFLVGDYQEKSLCIAQVSEFAETMSVRRKYRESIEQCLDEMLMNALYDAPVDENGRPIFSEIPTKTRISLRVEQKVVVQYACDGKQFVVGVRDSFGTLDRATVLRYLHKCLHSDQQIDRKTGGAGLGLYLITNSSTGVFFNVLPGVATEAVCTFDLETPKIQLETIGFFVEKIDAAGRLASGPSKRLPAGSSHPVERRHPNAPSTGGSRILTAVLTLAVLAALGLVAFAAWPRIFGPAKTAIQVHTVPTGASVEIGGKPIGTTPLTVKTLAPGSTAALTFKKAGYHDAVAKLTVPGPGKEATLIQPLAVSEVLARVHLSSEPPGAQVLLNGQLVAGVVTPTDVLVEAGKVPHFTLTLPHRIPALLAPAAAPRSAEDIDLSGKLVEGTTLHLKANVDGRFRVAGAPHCQDVAPPFDCVLAPGSHTIDFVVAQAPRIYRNVTVKNKDFDVKFELGFVEAGAGKMVQITPSTAARRAVYEVGTRRVTVTSAEEGPHQVTVTVRLGATTVVN